MTNDIQHTEQCVELGHTPLCMGECTREASEPIRTALSGVLGSALDFLIDGDDDDEIASRLNVAVTAVLAEFEARNIRLLVPGITRVVGDAEGDEPNYIETTLVTPTDKHGDTRLRLEVAGENQFISVSLSPAKLATLLGYGDADTRTVATLRADHRCPLCNGTEAA
ncbi:MAG: hypothetical protein AB7T06_24800 [Kofleriaceae bacterium]